MKQSEQLLDFIQRNDVSAVVRDRVIQVWAMNLADLEETKEFAGKLKYWANIHHIVLIVIDEYNESQREYWKELGALFNEKESPCRFVFPLL